MKEPSTPKQQKSFPVAEVIVLVAGFALLERLVRLVGLLPAEAYFREVIAVGLIQRVAALSTGWPGLILFAGIAATTVVAARARRLRPRLGRLRSSWSTLEHGTGLRVLIGIVAMVSAWAFSTYDYNLYFDQAHYADRILLIALAGLVIWRPFFALPFVFYLVAIIGQLDHPMAAFPWTEMNLLIRILALFAVAFLIAGFTGRWNVQVFVLVLCCLFAVNYWWSGVGKIRLNWISHPHLNLVLLGAYANGWLGFLESSTIVRLSEALAPVNIPLMLFTLLVEWGALFLMWRKYTLVGFLMCAIAFHMGIFFYTGMLFWKWILVEAALLWFLLRADRTGELPLFGLPQFLTSVLLILACPLWVKPTNLSWYDTPLTYTYRLDGIGPDGRVFELPTSLFSPYSDVFFLGLFQFLTENPPPTTVMGAALQHPLADSIVNAKTAAQALAIDQQSRPSQFDPQKGAQFDDFIVRFVGTLNRRGTQWTWLTPLRAPRHLWSYGRDDSYAMQGRITRVVVSEVLSFYDGESYKDIQKRPVREIPIPND